MTLNTLAVLERIMITLVPLAVHNVLMFHQVTIHQAQTSLLSQALCYVMQGGTVSVERHKHSLLTLYKVDTVQQVTIAPKEHQK